MGVKSTFVPFVSILSLAIAPHAFAVDLPWKKEKAKNLQRQKAIPYLGAVPRDENPDWLKFFYVLPPSIDPLNLRGNFIGWGWNRPKRNFDDFESFASLFPLSTDPLSYQYPIKIKEGKESSEKSLPEYLLVADPFGRQNLWPYEIAWPKFSPSEKPLHEYLLVADPFGRQNLWPYEIAWPKFAPSEKSLQEYLLVAEPFGRQNLWPYEIAWPKFGPSEKSLHEYLLVAEPFGRQNLWPYEIAWPKFTPSEKSLQEYLLVAEPFGRQNLWPYEIAWSKFAPSGKLLQEYLLVAEPFGRQNLWPYETAWPKFGPSEKSLHEYLLVADPFGRQNLWPYEIAWSKFAPSGKLLQEYLLIAEPFGRQNLWPYEIAWSKFAPSGKPLQEYLLVAEPFGRQNLWPYETAWPKFVPSGKSLQEYLLAAEPFGRQNLWPYQNLQRSKEVHSEKIMTESIAKEEIGIDSNETNHGIDGASGSGSPFRIAYKLPFREMPKIANRQERKKSDPDCVDREVCFRLKTYLLAHGGFRYDQVTCTNGIMFPNNFEMLDDPLSAKHLQIYETGIKALAAFDENWYLKGFYSYGWIIDGDFLNVSISGSQRGSTQDALVGLGYLFLINRSCSLGVLGGWGFDEQETKLKDADPAQFENLKFQSIWNGPWLGLDFFAWRQTSFVLNLGYEFHLADWDGAWLLDQELSNAFSDRRKGGISFGQVVYFDLKWDFYSPHWRADLEFKYQNWSTHSSGVMNSTSSRGFDSAPISGPVSAITFVKEAAWSSYGVSLNLGYSF